MLLGLGSALTLAMPAPIPEDLKLKFFILLWEILATNKSRKNRITSSHIAVASFSNYQHFGI